MTFFHSICLALVIDSSGDDCMTERLATVNMKTEVTVYGRLLLVYPKLRMVGSATEFRSLAPDSLTRVPRNRYHVACDNWHGENRRPYVTGGRVHRRIQ
jgi:hypothetical protein